MRQVNPATARFGLALLLIVLVAAALAELCGSASESWRLHQQSERKAWAVERANEARADVQKLRELVEIGRDYSPSVEEWQREAARSILCGLVRLGQDEKPREYRAAGRWEKICRALVEEQRPVVYSAEDNVWYVQPAVERELEGAPQR